MFVNDANWRSRNTYGSLFDLSLVDLKSDSQASKRVVVDRQRWIEINPTELKLGEGIGALLCVVNNPKEEWPSGPDSIVALQPQDLAAPFRIPAYWGTSFELSVVAVPPAGCEHDGDLGEWIRMAPFARAIVTFPDVNTPAITQFVALR